MKTCECGCGQPTTITKLQGHNKGKYNRYVCGHQWTAKKRFTTKERFWSKVDIKGDSECWEWKKYIDRPGYGKFWFEERWQQAHRIAFILSGGIISEEKPHVLHKCDNPKCVNPSHLYAGNQTDNMRDRSARGRWRGGEQNGEKSHYAKLTNGDVLKIRHLCDTTSLSQDKIALMFGVSRANIGYIKDRKSWTHI